MLVVQNLSCEVAGRTLFDDQSFSVEDGHILVIQGPSGVGKSRLLRVISCLDPLKEGSLSLDGQSAQRLGLTNWRARVIYIPQSRVALQGSLREYFLTLLNLAAQKRTLALVGQQDTKRLIDKLEVLIRRVGLVSDTHAQEFDEGHSFLERKWDSLSGGEYQRVVVCCGLALGPQVLLLDEPTSALDVASALLLEQVLTESTSSLLWVTHDAGQALRLESGVRAGRCTTLNLTPYLPPSLDRLAAPLPDEAPV